MKRKHILTLILASFFILVSFHGGDVNAQTSISGDTLCGGSKVQIVNGKIVSGACGVADIATIFKGIFSTIIALGLPLLVIFIMYRFIVAYYQLAQGNANAYKEAIGKVTQAIIGFIIIVALFGGILLVMLRYFGVKEFPLKLLDSISSVVITRAYAAAPYPKGACPSKPEGYSCITDSGSVGFCVNGGYMGQCQDLSSSAVEIQKGNCGGKGTGLSCITDDDKKGGACFAGRCILLLGNPPTPANVGNLNIYTCPDGTKAEKPALCPVVTQATSSAQAPTPAPAPVTTSCGTTGLPNPLGFCSLYEFILSALSLVLKFFIYPALIAIWVWTGFSYVLAQGAPEKLMKAHKLLMWAFISTFIVFITQAFLIALRGSVEKIVPSSSMVIPVSKLSIEDNYKFISKKV